MKKRITAFVLCVLLLTGSVFAAAGDAGDPLITLSWLTDTFLPEMSKSFGSIADKAVRNYQSGDNDTEPAVKSLTLKAGEGLEFSEGQYFVLLSGSASLNVTQGTAVNATQGWETSGGAVRIGNRYIFCENAAGYLNAVSDCTVSASYGAKAALGCPFTDVKRSDWFYNDVANAVALGLVNGTTPTTYEPKATLTVAQAVKLAACMHQLYYDDEVTLCDTEDGKWYDGFVEYAEENDILTQPYADYDAAICRRDFVEIFYRALPRSSYRTINSIPDDAIPDVEIDDDGADEIYTFYRAGILSGYTGTPNYAEHSFGPGNSILRAEVAAIMSRMLDSTVRLSFEID